MAADTLRLHFDLSTGTDYSINGTYHRDFIGDGRASDNRERSPPFSASGNLSSSTFDLWHSLCTPGLEAWNTEVPAAQFATRFVQHPIHSLSYAQSPSNTGQFREEDGARAGPASARRAEALRGVSKRPMPSDWCRWQPMILEKYKRCTARMILEDLHSEGFDVT